MKHSISVFLCSILALGINLNVTAQHYKSATQQTQHYIDLSLGGGADFLIPTNSIAKAGIGADANLGLEYSLNSNGFLFLLGINGDFQLGTIKLPSYDEYRIANDFEGEQFNYVYRYSDYIDHPQTIYAAGKIMLGYQAANNIYFMVGAHVKLPLYSTYKIHTDLLTAGCYDSFKAEYITDVPSYGFYPKDTYSDEGKKNISDLVTVDNLWICPELEIGYNFNLNKKTDLHLGLYGSYGFRLTQPTGYPIGYSKLITNMGSQSQENLRENLTLSTMLYTSVPGKDAADGVNIYKRDGISNGALSDLVIGVRATFLFNVTHKKQPFCHCNQEHKPIFHKTSKKYAD